MRLNRMTLAVNFLLAGLFGMLVVSCGKGSLNDMIIISQAPVNAPPSDLIAGKSWRYVAGARIIAVDPEKPSSVQVLTPEFYAACAPVVSFDGRLMYFSAKQQSGDPWQIWEMDLASRKSRKVTSVSDCIDPVCLPAGQLVFSKLTKNDTVKTTYALYACKTDGSQLRQITFSPQADLASSVLKDGRLLTITHRLFPENEGQVMNALRPDGTKADIFYKGEAGSKLAGRAQETPDGRIVFIEAVPGENSPGNVISISYNRPLHSRRNLTAGLGGDFNAVFPLKSGRLMVSCRKPGLDHFALFEFDPSAKTLGKVLFDQSGYNVLEALMAEERDIPKKLPSEVDFGVKTGLLLCQDINVLSDLASLTGASFPKASKVEILGIDSSMGIVRVEKDGSFYLKIMANTPFRLRTLDNNNKVLNGPCEWIWLRPNERRGCVGCHEDQELVPENKVPLAVKSLPVAVPVHVSGINEKEVELE